jgi:methionyl-tRNA formyltransferase
MEIVEKKIVMWCDGSANQKALAAKMAQQFLVVGIIIDEKKSLSKKRTIKSPPLLVWDRLKFFSVYRGWKKMQQYYQERFRNWPEVPVLRVPSINSDEAEDFTKRLSPDLVVVSGTQLIKETMLNIPVEIGMINLHTGLSPYVKGGPNCTNWCIANNEWHLIGNTIMWINAGIDSGNIITTETIDIRKAGNLFEAHKLVMEHAHDLYIRAIEYLITHSPPYQSIQQNSLGKGRLFLTKMWTAEKRKLLLENWRKRNKVELHQLPICVSLPAEKKHE